MTTSGVPVVYVPRPLTDADGRQICAWRYPEPYDLYNIDMSNLSDLLDPAQSTVAVDDVDGILAGFFTFGRNARVGGAERAGLYRAPALDLGLGMRPDLTGSGNGLSFVNAGLDYATQRFQPSLFRLVVAAFNTRAIRVYERAGFAAGATFMSPVRQREIPFLLMTRPAAARRDGS